MNIDKEQAIVPEDDKRLVETPFIVFLFVFFFHF